MTPPGRNRIELFREINDLAAKPDKRAEAMKAIDEGLGRSRDGLRPPEQRAGGVGQGRSARRAGDRDRMKKILEGATELQAFLDKLKKIDAEENDPRKKTWLAQFEQGQRLEKDLEIDKAIALYEGMLKERRPGRGRERGPEEAPGRAAREVEAEKPGTPQRAEVHLRRLADAGRRRPQGQAAGRARAYIACKAAGDLTSLTKLFGRRRPTPSASSRNWTTLKPRYQYRRREAGQAHQGGQRRPAQAGPRRE